MKKQTFLASFIILVAVVIQSVPAETLFLHVNDKMIVNSLDILDPVRDGILDGLFENGHIAFDSGPREETDNVSVLVGIARNGGAQYLVVVTLSDEIELSAGFSVFESAYGRSLFDGVVRADGVDKEKHSMDNSLVFKLGQEISAQIHQYFTSFQKNSNL